MPENPSSKDNRVSPGEQAKGSPDPSTIAGIVLAFSGIIGGLLLEKGNIQDVIQLTAAMIVLGGTCGAVLVTTPLPVVLRACSSLKELFFEPGVSPGALIERLLYFGTAARKSGIVSLESEVEAIPDPFFRKAMGLAVDGADLQELRQILQVDIILAEQRREDEAKVWESAGGYAPTIGIIGAVMGLIQVMKNLEDIKVVGHGIAVAFVATLYGIGSANIFFLPAAAKLRARMRRDLLMKEMLVEGVAGICVGLNPTMIRLKLSAFDDEPGKAPKAKAGVERAMEAAVPGR